MQTGLRQRLIVLTVAGLFLAMTGIGAFRIINEKQAVLADARSQGEESGRLLAAAAGPLLAAGDEAALRRLGAAFLSSPDAQEFALVNASGREIVRAVRPELEEDRISQGPFPVLSEGAVHGRLRVSFHPADLTKRLAASALGALLEYLVILVILAVLLFFSLTRTVTLPVLRMERAVREMIEQRDFTRRVDPGHSDETGRLASAINLLVERQGQFVDGLAAIAGRIGELSPGIAGAAREIRQNSSSEADAAASVVTSVGNMSASVRSVAESAESLSTSAEETSSAILQMNASNQEVARHTSELASSVDDVTTSVTEMIASIREVAEHIRTVSAASEATSASAIRIGATVREVEEAARESSRLSEQVSAEARDIGVRSIEETRTAMQRIKDSVIDYSGLVARLGERSGEIGKILGVIVEVTERTNLLALNASILAAQAGEHGRGFSVVAGEIKALADRTAASAQDIAKLIQSVQRETREAVAAIDGSLSAVEEGVARSEAADSALKKILATSGRSAETAGMIERAMTDQSQGIRQVSDAAGNVKQMMAQIAAATEAQTRGTEMILKASEEMRGIARRVRDAIAEQERGGRLIAQAAENVTRGAGTIAAGSWEQGQAGAQILQAMERMQELPLRNKKRIEDLSEALGMLEEQAGLLNRELTALRPGGAPEAPGVKA